MEFGLIEQYINKLNTELKLNKVSEKTKFVYTYFVKKFLLNLDKLPEKATEYDVKAFLAKNIDNYSTKSYALLLSSLRFFFKYIIKSNAMIDIRTPKIEKEIKDVLTQEEVKSLIEIAPNYKSKLIISMLYSTGLRISELVSLNKQDLNLERHQGIVKKGKGKKDRLLFFSKELVEPLSKYLKTVQGDFVFPGWKGNKMHPRNVQNLLNRLKIKAKITKKVSPHTLRRSYATHLHEEGVDIRLIQVFLGHSRIDTTEHYVDVSTKTLKDVKNPFDSLKIKI